MAIGILSFNMHAGPECEERKALAEKYQDALRVFVEATENGVGSAEARTALNTAMDAYEDHLRAHQCN